MTEEAPFTYEGTELVVTLNKGPMYMWFWVSVVSSVIAGCYFFFMHNGVLYNKSNFSFFIFVTGGGAAVLFYFASKNNRAELLVNRNGIWERSLGQIPWDEIRSFSIVCLVRKKVGVNYLILQDHKLQEKSIGIQQFNKNEDEIVAAIWHYAKKYEIYYAGKIETES